MPKAFPGGLTLEPAGLDEGGRFHAGGSIQRKHFPTYAEYFRKFLESYAAAGVPVDAVTVQNEVDTPMVVQYWEWFTRFLPGLRQLVMEHSEGGAKTQIAVLLFIRPFEIEVRELESW